MEGDKRHPLQPEPTRPMIYTRYGTPVTILADTGEGWVKCYRNGVEHEYRIIDLRADDGAAEIMAAIEATKQQVPAKS